MATKIIGVLGMGIFGQTLAEELSQFGQEVIAIDTNAQHIQAVADTVSKAIIGDITNLETLSQAGIGQCDTVIIATGNNLESSVLALMNCKKLKVPHIIAKAKTANFEEVLYSIGAHEVISPERFSGRKLAQTIMQEKINDIYHLEGNVSIIEFTVPEQWVGKTLLELNIRQNFDLNLIGIRATKTAPLDINLPIQTHFQQGMILVAIANSRTFEKYDYLGYFS